MANGFVRSPAASRFSISSFANASESSLVPDFFAAEELMGFHSFFMTSSVIAIFFSLSHHCKNCLYKFHAALTLL